MALMDGKSFIELTVRRKLVLWVLIPSLTFKLIVAVPNWLVRVRKVKSRFEPPPPRKRLALGTSAGFVELAVTTRLSAGVSVSPTVKRIGTGAASSLIV